MASTLSKIGIVTGQLVEPQHVTQSIDAFTGIKAYDISLSGSFNMTGSIIGQPGTINPLTASFAQTASYVTGSIFAGANRVSSASYALSASYAPGGGVTQIVAGNSITISPAGGTGIVTINSSGGSGTGFPFSGSAVITGSLVISGSGLTVTGSINNLLIGTGNRNVPTNISIGSTTAFSSLPLSTGGYNIAIGSSSLQKNQTGKSNTAIGLNTLDENTVGSNNLAIKCGALTSNTSGDHNTAIGCAALLLNKSGNYNTAIGKSALLSNTLGNYNTAIGNLALFSNTSGSHNTAIGSGSLQNNTSGSHNIAIGRAALLNNTTGSNNTAIGQCALCCNTIGSNNIAFGQNAGRLFSGSSSNNIAIGFGAGPSANTEENSKLYIASGSGTPLIKGDFFSKTVNISGSVIVMGSLTGSLLDLSGNATTITCIPPLTGHVTSTGTNNLTTTITPGVVTNAMLAGSIANTKLLQIASAGCVTNAATTATNLNTANAIVARDASNNFCAGTITATLSGNANTVTTIPALTGDICSAGNVTTICANKVTNAMLNGSIANAKLLQITSAGCVTNAATTATNLNTANAIVARDANGDFCAGTITANLNGNASTVTTIPALTGHVTSTGTNNLVTTIGNLCVTNNMIVNATIANCKTTATAANTPSKIVCRDANKDFCAGTITATLAGNATTVTTIPALTGHVTSTGTSNATTIAAGVVTNAMLAAGSISPSKTNATLLNTANTIILRQSTTSSPPIISSIEFQPLTTAPTSPTMGTVYVKFVNNQFAPKTLMIYTCYPDTSTFPATMTPGFYQVDSY